MEKDIVINKEKMYRLFNRSGEGLYLGVLCGGFAMYEITFRLSQEEEAKYQAEGNSFLDSLSDLVAKHPENYESRT